jgi:hypothetical protein
MKFTALLPSLLAAGTMAIATALPATAATLVPGSTDTYQFENVFSSTTENLAGDDFVNFFRVRVTAASDGTVLFRFSVASSVSFFVDQVYFNYFGAESASLLSNPVVGVNNVGIVNFQASSGNLPDGDDPNVSFLSENTFFTAAAVAGRDANLLQANETLGIRFTGDYAAVLTALADNTLRIGISAGGFSNGGRDTFVTGPAPAAPAEDPIVSDPIVEDPIVEDPIVEDPIIDDPIVEDPIVEDPIVEDPIIDDPIVEDPIINDPIVEDPIIEDPIVNDPIVDDPIVEDPIVNDPIVTDPVVTDPVVADPIVEEPPVVAEPTTPESPIVTQPPIEEVPEPMTLLGTGLAIGVGTWLKRRQRQS